jgi:hypothetical protein
VSVAMSDMRRIRDGARSLPMVQLGSAGMGAGGGRAGMGLYPNTSRYAASSSAWSISSDGFLA